LLYKGFEAKTCFKRCFRVCGSDFSHRSSTLSSSYKRMPCIGPLSLRVLVWHLILIGFDHRLTPLIGITGKRELLTCTQDTTGAKLEQLRSARLIHHNQNIMTRHSNAFNKANGLISLLAPTLSTIKHVISQVKLINMRMFASYSKHAN
jgi:hypothetical protein